jgi:hypothetical protein
MDPEQERLSLMLGRQKFVDRGKCLRDDVWELLDLPP